MSNYLDKTNLIPDNEAGRAGFAVRRSDGQVILRRGAQIDKEPLASDAAGPVTSNITLKTKDNGRTVFAKSSSFITVTLPTAAAGLKFIVMTQTVPSATGTTITPQSGDKFQGDSFNAKTAGQSLVNTQATAAIGDTIELIGSDDGIWFVRNKIGTWA